MSVKDDLIAAKALISNPNNWRQDGRYGFGTGCYCAVGAIFVCCPGIIGKRWAERVIPLCRALTDALPLDTFSIFTFNDDPNTTHADVMALFDRAIEACDPE